MLGQDVPLAMESQVTDIAILGAGAVGPVSYTHLTLPTKA